MTGILFTCTGRGRPGEADYHERAVAEALNVAFPNEDPGRRRRARNVGLELRCPVCGLTKSVGYKTRKRLAGAGITEADISGYPF